MGRELDESMNNKPAFACGVGARSGGSGAGDLAFRGSIPFRGDGMLRRNAGPCFLYLTRFQAGSPIQVSWGPDVSWRKRIRVLAQ
jgi:hypothetical protein